MYSVAYVRIFSNDWGLYREKPKAFEIVEQHHFHLLQAFQENGKHFKDSLLLLCIVNELVCFKALYSRKSMENVVKFNGLSFIYLEKANE